MNNWELSIYDLSRKECPFLVDKKEVDSLLCNNEEHIERIIIIGGKNFGLCLESLCPYLEK